MLACQIAASVSISHMKQLANPTAILFHLHIHIVGNVVIFIAIHLICNWSKIQCIFQQVLSTAIHLISVLCCTFTGQNSSLFYLTILLGELHTFQPVQSRNLGFISNSGHSYVQCTVK